MKICFYTDQRISGTSGGIGRVTDVLARHFHNAFGWKIYSIYGRESFGNVSGILRDDIRTGTEDYLEGSMCLRLHDRMGLRPEVRHNVKRAVKFINENDIDVIIIQTSLDVPAKLQGKISARMVSVLHFEPGRDEWPWKSAFGTVRNYFNHRATVKAYRTAYQYCDKVLVLSGSYIPMYAEFAGLDETNRLVALANPLSFSSKETEVTIVKKRIALVVARMEDTQKRISHILRIWHKAIEQHSNWILKIVGDGPSLESYKKLAKDLDLTNVEFTGRQNPIPYYREAGIFLMASSFEGFPMTLVEAQQFGCVPIAYDSFAALKDVVTDKRNGLVIKDLDEKAYIDALRGLMGNDEERSLLSANAKSDCQRFNIETIGEQWQKLL